MAVRQPADRPRRSWPARLLRGVPITAGLSAALLLTLVTVPILRLVSAARRWKDVQVPLVTDAPSYKQVAQRVPTILEEHGRVVRRVSPPWWLTAPLRVLSAMDHDAFQSRIPTDLAYFAGRDLTLALYPSGLLIRGRPDALAAAQGLIVEGVSDLEVWQTSDSRAQAIERRIAHLWQAARGSGTGRLEPVSAARLRDIVRAIEGLPVEYDEWQIVYRKAVQVSRALEGKPQLLAGLIHREETMQRYEDRAPTNGTSVTDGGSSSWKLVGDVGGRILQLAQSEVELASAELASDLQAARRTAVGLAVAAVAAIIGVTLLLVAAVLALIPFMPGWLAALLVAGVVFGVGATAGLSGWARRPRSPLARTRKSLKEDWEWLKERVA